MCSSSHYPSPAPLLLWTSQLKKVRTALRLLGEASPLLTLRHGSLPLGACGESGSQHVSRRKAKESKVMKEFDD